ncbi:SGNH hydrolase domain-containing protein [Arthrobacter sp. NPDC058192]|uniref:SGNH hydrolase domain-containing protein n=1 Tax=Arthrobacter sp. NPDC058192 TaxID=3346372 RepID=UPI0036E7D7CF
MCCLSTATWHSTDPFTRPSRSCAHDAGTGIAGAGCVGVVRRRLNRSSRNPQVPGVEVVDLHSHFCQQDVCPAVIGNALVYRDNHMANTFAKTLAPALAKGLGL